MRALDKAIAAIEAAARIRRQAARHERRARRRCLAEFFLADDTGLLTWLGEGSRRPGRLAFGCLAEAVRRLTVTARIERGYVLENDWKARPELLAAQRERLVVARYVRRFSARRSERRAA
jgi:hypothetical protein